MIVNKKCKQTGFVNNDQLSIGAICKEFRKLQEKDGTLEITAEEFQENFCVADCITTHSSQGATIDTPKTIHEFIMMDNNLREASLSRITNKTHIKVSLKYIDTASNTNDLRGIYFDRSGFRSLQTAYKDAKEKDQPITMNDVKDYFEELVGKKKRLTGFSYFIAGNRQVETLLVRTHNAAWESATSSAHLD